LSGLALSRLILPIQILSVEDEKNQLVPISPALEEISSGNLLHQQSSGKINQKNQMLRFIVLWHPGCVLTQMGVKDDYH